jgi:DNA-directed RNA polymerase specialized sigma24 family protein
MANLPSSLLKAYEELGTEEKQIFWHRYVRFESIEQTCAGLQISSKQYKERLESCLRAIRRQRSAPIFDNFVPDLA